MPTHDPCIQSVFLKDITAAYDKTPKLESLLFDDFFNKGELRPSGIVLTSEYSFLDSDPSSAARVEACRRTEHSMGYTDAGFHHRSVVLRRLQERDCPCQPTASATRLLRCSHFPRPARKRERALRHWPEHPCVFLSPFRQRVGNYRTDCRSLSQQTSTGLAVVEMSRPAVTSHRAVLPWCHGGRAELSRTYGKMNGICRESNKVKIKQTLYGHLHLIP